MHVTHNTSQLQPEWRLCVLNLKCTSSGELMLLIWQTTINENDNEISVDEVYNTGSASQAVLLQKALQK